MFRSEQDVVALVSKLFPIHTLGAEFLSGRSVARDIEQHIRRLAQVSRFTSTIFQLFASISAKRIGFSFSGIAPPKTLLYEFWNDVAWILTLLQRL